MTSDSPLVLVSLLGTGAYQPTTFRWQGLEHRTAIFADAVARWLQPRELVVLITPAVESHENWQSLLQSIKGVCPVRPVSIPNGMNESELWGVFGGLVDSLPIQSHVVLDVSHGFRSLPMVTLMAALYLRQTERVTVEAILYGAYEARDETTDIAPVFDLTPFLDMADWWSAANQFTRTGNGTELAHLLKQLHRNAYIEPATDARERPQRLQTLGNNLGMLSDALALTRPAEIAKTAAAVRSAVEGAHEEVAVWARPFQAVVSKLEAETAWMADSSLEQERQLIHWYFHRKLVVQGVTLTREWLISVACANVGVAPDSFGDRKHVERTLGWLQIINAPSGQGQSPEPDIEPYVARLKSNLALIDCWNRVADLRNDVDHCGHRLNPRSVKVILKAVEPIREAVDKISIRFS